MHLLLLLWLHYVCLQYMNIVRLVGWGWSWELNAKLKPAAFCFFEMNLMECFGVFVCDYCRLSSIPFVWSSSQSTRTISLYFRCSLIHDLCFVHTSVEQVLTTYAIEALHVFKFSFKFSLKNCCQWNSCKKPTEVQIYDRILDLLPSPPPGPQFPPQLNHKITRIFPKRSRV